MKNYYDILGVARNASDKEIQKAYRALALKHHPDKKGDPEKCKDINAAHENLLDPEKRHIHDGELEAHERGHSHSIPIFHTPQQPSVHVHIPHARPRVYHREVNDAPCLTAKQISYLKTGAAYFGIFFVCFVTIETLFRPYLHFAITNPAFLDTLKRLISESFHQTINTDNPLNSQLKHALNWNPHLGGAHLERISSNVCGVLGNAYGYLGRETPIPPELRECSISSEQNALTINGRYSIVSGNHFYPRFLKRHEIHDHLLTLSAVALTYTSLRTFHLYKNGERFIAPNLSTPEKLDRLILLLLIAGLMLIGLDALTGAFGLVNSVFTIPSDGVSATCALACNAGFSERYSLHNSTTHYTFRHPEETLADIGGRERPPVIASLNHTTAAVLNMVVPPAAALISRFTGLWARGRHPQNDEKHEHQNGNQRQCRG